MLHFHLPLSLSLSSSLIIFLITSSFSSSSYFPSQTWQLCPLTKFCFCLILHLLARGWKKWHLLGLETWSCHLISLKLQSKKGYIDGVILLLLLCIRLEPFNSTYNKDVVDLPPYTTLSAITHEKIACVKKIKLK